MFLYRRRLHMRRRRRSHFSRNNLRTTFQTNFILGRIDGIEPQITWLDFSRSLAWPWH